MTLNEFLHNDKFLKTEKLIFDSLINDYQFTRYSTLNSFSLPLFRYWEKYRTWSDFSGIGLTLRPIAYSFCVVSNVKMFFKRKKFNLSITFDEKTLKLHIFLFKLLI